MNRNILWTLVVALWLPLIATAAAPLGSTRALTVPFVTPRPVIDGNVDDGQWAEAASGSDFWISIQQRAPTEQTEVLVMSDDEYLYVAFRCFDNQPDQIQATKTRRDGGLGNDDRVEIELDAFRNFRTISTYSVNLNGTQSDSFSGGRARKIEWKGDWHAAASRTAYGWSAEFAIPFKILNYQLDSDTFGVNFLRYHNRTDELSRWADVTPQGKREEMGKLTGLRLPAKAKDKPLTVMPYVLGAVNVPNIKGEERDKLFSAGATIRYEPRPNFTGVVSLYPDFTQLETQVTGIDFSYTEKFRSDPRPFFQEGSFYLGQDTEYFYSNRIPDFYAGGKLFAQPGDLQVGTFITDAPYDRQDAGLRLVRELGPRRSVGMMLIATSREDLENQLLVAQLDGREESGLTYSADLAYTNTHGRSFEQGGVVKGKLGWTEDFWNAGISADYYEKEYFPANGLIKTDRYGTKSVNAAAGYYREPGTGPFRYLSGNVALNGRDTHDGRTQNHNLYIDGGFELREPQIALNLSYSEGKYRRTIGRGKFSNILNNDHYWAANLDLNTRSSVFGYGGYYANGEIGGDDYRYFTRYLWLNPTDETFVKISSERLDNFGTFKQKSLQAGWNITPNDGIVGRYIEAEEGNYKRLAYRRTVRSGVDVFAVYNKEPFTDGQFSVKLVWVWDH